MFRISFLIIAVLGMSAGLAFAATPGSVTVQVVDTRGVPVRDAVVEIDVAAASASPIRFPWRMAMAQKNEQFVPGTLIIAKGSTVAFPNLDTFRHSIYSFSKAARFQIDLYSRDQTRTHSFPITGTVALGCNIHDQMRGYIRVVDTPYAAKTDGNGYATIDAVPPGAARMTIWHPRLRSPSGTLTKALQISGTDSTQKIAVTLR